MENWEIVKAVDEGKAVEHKNKGFKEWDDFNPRCKVYDFDLWEYRLKPNHKPNPLVGKHVTDKDTGGTYIIEGFSGRTGNYFVSCNAAALSIDELKSLYDISGE